MGVAANMVAAVTPVKPGRGLGWSRSREGYWTATSSTRKTRMELPGIGPTAFGP